MSSGGGIDSHIENINRLCRFCGDLNLTKAEKDKKLSALNCEQYAPKIKDIWGIEIARDRPYLHPKFFCRKCRSRLYNPPKFARAKRISWYPHTFGNDCMHCEKVQSLTRGGRRPMNKSSGRPKKTKTTGQTAGICEPLMHSTSQRTTATQQLHLSPACTPVTTSYTTAVEHPTLQIYGPAVPCSLASAATAILAPLASTVHPRFGVVYCPVPPVSTVQPQPGVAYCPVPPVSTVQPQPGVAYCPVPPVSTVQPQPGVAYCPVPPVSTVQPQPGVAYCPVPPASTVQPQPGVAYCPVPPASTVQPQPGVAYCPVPPVSTVQPQPGVAYCPVPPVSTVQPQPGVAYCPVPPASTVQPQSGVAYCPVPPASTVHPQSGVACCPVPPASTVQPQPGVACCPVPPAGSGSVTADKVTIGLKEKGPLNADQRLALYALVKRQTDNNTLLVPTGAKPLHFVQVPTCQKKSCDAAASTVQKRAKLVSNIREQISGGAEEQQMAAELRRLPRSQLSRLLQEGRFAQVRIPDGHLLGLKTGLNLNWSQCRDLRRWMKDYNIAVESERTSRNIASELLSATDVMAEQLPFTTKDEEGGKRVEPKPCAYLVSLVSAMHDYLERSKQAGKLTWHGGNIPEDEIWVKIGGDHGGPSFKMAFQPLNVLHPNSKTNTSVFCLFESKDNRENITTALGRFKDDVKTLQEEMWRSKDGQTYRIKLFMAGDYAFLSTIYGISGAAGTFPCLWCKVTKAGIDDIENRRLRTPDRTLANMAENLRAFLQEGRGSVKKAQEYFNVIAAPLFEIPLEQAIVPGLHISLGVFKRLYDEFERAVQELDLKIQAYLHSLVLAQEADREDVKKDQHLKPFEQFINVIDDAQVFQVQADELDDLVEEQENQLAFLAYENQDVDDELAEAVFNEATAMVSELVQRRDTLRKKASDILTKASVKPGKGPLASQLEPVMKSFKVHREAYQGRTFVGNHVNKMLNDKPIEHLTSSVVKTMGEICDGNDFPLSIIRMGKEVAERHEKRLKMFAKCHKGYAHGGKKEDKDLDQLDLDIKSFMSEYRKDSRCVSLKMHLLEEHVVPCIRRWGFGLGFLAEQGIEEVHAQFNRLAQSTRSIADPVARLKSTLKSHLIKVSPDHTGKVPAPVKRKKTV
ncbi:uncharacterized protein LOC118422598 [Branchiostoma floridae]|uniref:Uncharacterized protein LOC118422598 n=2 Tax=Branchiostoma floridae TaxID=7739 RepID=A0A9J7LPP9_BRAFL|nr:uncharacterized protein LOC118422598 [Branchiostoma floridae]